MQIYLDSFVQLHFLTESTGYVFQLSFYSAVY